jgi:hypothetical protein
MHPAASKHLEIRLNASATARVGAGDRQNARKAMSGHGDGRIGAFT